jgi:hypothetical protein
MIIDIYPVYPYNPFNLVQNDGLIYGVVWWIRAALSTLQKYL